MGSEFAFLRLTIYNFPLLGARATASTRLPTITLQSNKLGIATIRRVHVYVRVTHRNQRVSPLRGPANLAISGSGSERTRSKGSVKGKDRPKRLIAQTPGAVD